MMDAKILIPFLLCRQLPGGVQPPSPGNCTLQKELCRCQRCLKGFQKLCKSKLMHWEMSFGNKISISSLWQSTGCMRWGEHISSHGERSASLIWGGSEIFQQAVHGGGPDSGSGVISINATDHIKIVWSTTLSRKTWFQGLLPIDRYLL